MDSPEHRGNILDRAFDEVGIGVVDQGKACYFITQDFIQSLEIMPVAEARKVIVSKIQDIRQAYMLPPLIIQESTNQMAQLFADARVQGQPPPPFPKELGETHVVYMIMPFLDNFSQCEDYLGQSKYGEAGVGVEFNRAASNPGGAYFVALMFLPSPPPTSLSPEFQTGIVLEALNKIRLESGLKSLRLEEKLSREAQKIGVALLARKNPPPLLTDHPFRVLFYYSQELDFIPQGFQPEIIAPAFNKVGLSVIFVKTARFLRGAYLVTIVLE
jgi:hypothetical protein